MQVTKTGLVRLGFAVLAVTLIVQVVDHFGQQSQVETQLASAINGYNGKTQETFRAELLGQLSRFLDDVQPEDIDIDEDQALDRVTVVVRFRSTLRLLVFPIERDIVVSRSAGLLR